MNRSSMKKIIFSVLIIVLSCCGASGQNHRADSLKKLLLMAHDPEERLQRYAEVSWAYAAAREELELAKLYADSLKEGSEKLGNERWAMRSYFLYGSIERFKGNHSASLEYMDKYIRYFSAAGDSNWVADGLFQMASVYSHMGDYVKSLAVFYRIIAIDEKLGNRVAVAHSLNSVGSIFHETKKYDEAIFTYKKALSIYDSAGRKSSVAMVSCNLGNIYTAMEQFDEAGKYYNRALRIDEELGINYAIALDLANIAFMYDGKKQYDSALIYHLKALKIRETLPNKNDLGRSLIGTGRGYKYVGNFPVAESYLLKALELSASIESKPLLVDVYSNLSELYEQTHDFKKSLHFLRLNKTMSDSILNAESAHQVNNLQVRYEAEKKDQQISLLAREKEIQEKEADRQATLKKTSFVGLALVTCMALIVGYSYNQKLRNQKMLAMKDNELNEEQFKRQVSEMEMKALRAQINPHFLFNCMNSINRMILEGENENASQYLAKFSKLIRSILENAESSRVSLQSELALLESYIQLETLRFKGKIHYKITLDDSVHPDTTYLPSMVLQPFVENAIWHGLMHKSGNQKGEVEISVREKEGRLYCVIEDNGVGREKARELSDKSVLKTKSMGLKITEERLRLLSKQGWEKLVNIIDLKDSFNNPLGTRVEINFPLADI